MNLQQDITKANELRLQAGELGSATVYYNIANSYSNGAGVERDTKKAKHYNELAAIGGDVNARRHLGVLEGKAGNTERVIKYFMIAARAGNDESLKEIPQLFMSGHATKNDFEKALRAHKEAMMR